LFWTFMANFVSCNLRKFMFIPTVIWANFCLPPDILSKFQFTPCHIIDFVRSYDLGGLLKQFFLLQIPHQQKNYGRQTRTYITVGKTLLTNVKTNTRIVESVFVILKFRGLIVIYPLQYRSFLVFHHVKFLFL